MNSLLSVVLFIVGVALVFFGVRASDSISSDVSRIFTDAPTDKAIWLLVVGAIVGIYGLVGMLRSTRSA